jgi:large subunit ribosomal protein L13
LATELARILSGRNRVDFMPNIDAGDAVVVINTDSIEVTGNKEAGKLYHHFSGYPGGLKTEMVSERRTKDSRKLLERAVYGMLPKNKLRAAMMGRLKLYRNDQHAHKTIHVKHD